jgi:hypothetical protein
VDAPEEVVGELLLARLLEAEYRRALRIHPAEDVPHHAVLAGRIKCLEHDEEGLVAVGIEQVLQLLHALEMLGDRRRGLLARLVLARKGRIDLGEAHLAARLDHEFLGVIHPDPPVTPRPAGRATR